MLIESYYKIMKVCQKCQKSYYYSEVHSCDLPNSKKFTLLKNPVPVNQILYNFSNNQNTGYLRSTESKTSKSGFQPQKTEEFLDSYYKNEETYQSFPNTLSPTSQNIYNSTKTQNFNDRELTKLRKNYIKDPITIKKTAKQAENLETNDFSNKNLEILFQAFKFLAEIPEFQIKLNDHICKSNCISCIFKEICKNPSKQNILFLNSQISSFYRTSPTYFSFSNCLQILLKYFHDIHSGSSTSNCYSECISHKLFGLNVYEEIKCECNKSACFE